MISCQGLKPWQFHHIDKYIIVYKSTRLCQGVKQWQLFLKLLLLLFTNWRDFVKAWESDFFLKLLPRLLTLAYVSEPHFALIYYLVLWFLLVFEFGPQLLWYLRFGPPMLHIIKIWSSSFRCSYDLVLECHI